MTQHLSEALLMDANELFDTNTKRCWLCRHLVLDIQRGYLCLKDPKHPEERSGVFLPTECKGYKDCRSD